MKGNFLFCKDLSGPTPFLDAEGVESIQWIHTLPCCNVCLCTKTPELASRRKLLCFKTKNKNQSVTMRCTNSSEFPRGHNSMKEVTKDHGAPVPLHLSIQEARRERPLYFMVLSLPMMYVQKLDINTVISTKILWIKNYPFPFTTFPPF